MAEEDNTSVIVKRRREIRSSEKLDSDEKAVADFKKLKEDAISTKKQQDGDGVNKKLKRVYVHLPEEEDDLTKGELTKKIWRLEQQRASKKKTRARKLVGQGDLVLSIPAFDCDNVASVP